MFEFSNKRTHLDFSPPARINRDRPAFCAALLSRRRAAVIVRRHSRAGRLAGAGVSLGSRVASLETEWLESVLCAVWARCLSAGCSFALVVPDNALTGMCHRLFPGGLDDPGEIFLVGAIIGVVPLPWGEQATKATGKLPRRPGTFLFFAETQTACT